MVSEFTPRFLAAAKARYAFAKAIGEYRSRVAADFVMFGRPTGRASAPGAARVFDMYWGWLVEDIQAVSKAMADASA